MELLVVVALLGILAGLAAPSFSGLFQRYRVDAVREDLIASLQLARVEAVRQGQSVVMLKQTGCMTLASTRDWSCGWILFVDLNSNGAHDSATEPLLQTTDLPPGVTVTKSDVQPHTRVTSDRFGQIPLAMHFLISPTNGSQANGVIVCKGAGSRINSIKGATSCS